MDNNPARLLDPGPPDFSFPYRVESLAALGWASEHGDDWIWDYLRALNLWAVDRRDEAASVLGELGQVPDFAPLYVARGFLLAETDGQSPEADLRRAVELAPHQRIFHVDLIRHLQAVGRWEPSLLAIDAARERFPNDFNLDLLQARSLLYLDRGSEAAEVLATTHVLPSENARESHRLWEQAHVMAALDALEAGDFERARSHASLAMEWPEHLGQGRPYEPEERLPRFVLILAEEGLGVSSVASEARAMLQRDLEARAAALAGELEGRLIRRAIALEGGDR